MPTLRKIISSSGALAALLIAPLVGLSLGAAAATPANTALVSRAADPFDLGHVYNLPNAGSMPVNTLTGDAQFTLPLGSIAGRNGLAYTIAARYSSNVMTQAGAWNGDQPTGAMGLGWTLDFPKVIVDTNGQTQQSSNDHYLDMNGQRSRLIPSGTDAQGNITYTTDTFANWRITFVAAAQRWDMVDERGFTYVFGDSAVAAQQATLQTKAAWLPTSTLPAPSFGPSSLPPTGVVTVVFNLARIVEPWGDALTFWYAATKVPLVGGGAYENSFVRESYLQAVRNSFGDTLALDYADKSNTSGSQEYVLPHNYSYLGYTAYQDRVETKYLTTVVSYKNGKTTADQTVKLSYAASMLNAAAKPSYAKRLLVAAQTFNASDRAAVPSTKFDYYTATGDANFGALKSVTSPSGMVQAYTYAQVQPTQGGLDYATGMGKDAKSWFGEDVVVLMDANTGNTNVYAWEGRWTVAANLGNLPTDAKVRIGKDTIGILSKRTGANCSTYKDSNGACPVVTVLHRSPGKPGWIRQDFVIGQADSPFANGSVLPPYDSFDLDAGTDIVALGAAKFTSVSPGASVQPELMLFKYRSGGFQAQAFSTAAFSGQSGGTVPQTRAAVRMRGTKVVAWFSTTYGSRNALVQPDAAGNPKASWTNPILGNLSYATAVDLEMGDGFFVIKAADCLPETGAFLVGTDGSTTNGIALFNDLGASCSYPIVIADRSISIGAFVSQLWGSNIVGQAGISSAATGPETTKGANNTHGMVFKGLTGVWSPFNLPVSANAVAAGRGYIAAAQSAQALAYWRTPDDTWTAGASLAGGGVAQMLAGRKGLVRMNGASSASVAYAGSNALDTPVSVAAAVMPLSNDQRAGASSLGDLSYLNVDGSGQLVLGRARDVLPYKLSGLQPVAVVTKVVSYNGYENVTNASAPPRTTQYVFDTANATMDPTGRYGRFNHVTVRQGAGTQGSTSPTDEHYGYSEVWQWNGFSPNPPHYAGQPSANEGDTYFKLDGRPYYAESWRERYANGKWGPDSVVGKGWTWYYTTIKDANPNTGYVGGLTSYTRTVRSDGQRDGTAIVTRTYNYLDATAGDLEGFLSKTQAASLNINGDAETVETSYTYAAQAYASTSPAWNTQAHMLTPVAGVISKRLDNNQILSNVATTYKVWDATGKALWGPVSSYSWQRNAASSSFNYTTPNPDWLAGPAVAQVNSAGAVTQTQFTYNDPAITVNSSVIYDKDSRFPVAGFSDATGAAGKYWGVESYEAPLGANGWVANNSSIVSGNANTGKQSLSMPGSILYGSAAPVTTNAGSVYVFSAYVNVPADSSVALELRGYVNGQQTKTTVRNFTPDPSQQGTWQYVEVYLPDADVATIAPWLTATNGPVLVDDLRFGPSEARFSAAVVDLDRGVVTATVGHNGEVARTLYDEFKQPVAAIAPGGDPVATAVGYSSRSGNNDSFNPNDPNSVAQVAARGEADYADFADSNPAPGKWRCMSGSCQPTAKGLSLTGSLQMANPVPYAMAVRAQIDYSSVASGTSYKLQLGSGGSSNCQNYGAGVGLFSGTWKLYQCNGSGYIVLAQAQETRPVGQIPRDWLFYHAAHRLIFFVGGKKVFDQVLNTPNLQAGTTFPVTVGTDNATSMTVRNVAVFNDPTLGGSFHDAAGRLLQATSVIDDNHNVNVSSGALYNGNWSRNVSTKAVTYSNAATGFSYVPNFVKRDANGTLLGDVAASYTQNTDTGYTNDSGYPYDGTSELPELPDRLAASGAPGADYSLNGQPATFSYGANAAAGSALPGGPTAPPTTSMPPFMKPNHTAFAGGQFRVSAGAQPTSQDTSGNVQALLGQSMRTPPGAAMADMIVGATTYGAANATLQTLRQQDTLDRTNLLYHPRYFASPSNEVQADLFKTTLSYNNYDRVTQVTLPNSGTTNIVYNKIGQLRFWMDANGAASLPNRVSYRKYDRLGRVVEEGFSCTAFNETQLRAQAEDASQPASSPLTWRRRYVYGVTPQQLALNSNLYQKGRLTAVMTNSGADSNGSAPVDPCDDSQKPTPNDTQVYVYDARGRTVAVYENTRPYVDGLVTTYAYNNLGQVTAIGNPTPVGAGVIGQGATSTVPQSGDINAAAKLQVSNTWTSNGYVKLSTAALSVLFGGATDTGAVAYGPTVLACLSNPACTTGVVLAGVTLGGAYYAYTLSDAAIVNQDSSSKTGTELGADFSVMPGGGSLQINQVTPPPLMSTLYTYDRAGRLTSIGRSLNGGTTVPDYYATYTWGVNGELMTETRNPAAAGNNINLDAPINIKYLYNSPGMLKSLTASLGGNVVPAYKQELFYNDAPAGFKTYDGRIGQMKQSFNTNPAINQTTTLDQLFTYFPEGGIKSAKSSGNFDAGVPVSAFDFAIKNKDANGNLRTITQNTTDYILKVQPDSDRLSQVNFADGSVKNAYTFDANGNVKSKTNHINSIAYDPFYNRPSAIAHQLGAAGRYYTMRYGGSAGDRVWQTYYDANQQVSVENTYFRGGGGNPLVIQYDTAPTYGVQARISRKTMVWGPTGLIAVNDTSSGAAKDYFIVPNHQGSTVQVWEKGNFAATVKQYAYTPTGNIWQHDGTLVQSNQMVPFLFQGSEYDWQSELHNFGMRSYDSDNVTFLQPDPQFSVGQSPYVAMDNDPVN